MRQERVQLLAVCSWESGGECGREEETTLADPSNRQQERRGRRRGTEWVVGGGRGAGTAGE